MVNEVHLASTASCVGDQPTSPFVHGNCIVAGSAKLPCHLLGEAQVSFGVNLRHVGRGMPEGNLSGFEAEALPDFGGGGMPKTVGTPSFQLRLASVAACLVIENCAGKGPR